MAIVAVDRQTPDLSVRNRQRDDVELRTDRAVSGSPMTAAVA